MSRRRLRVIAAVLAGVALLAGCSAARAPAPPAAGAVLDNCGVEIPLRSPTKIFAAFQNAIEAVYALGAGDKVVGAAYLDNRLPPQIAAQFRPRQQRPTYFPEEYPSREEVLRLGPDLVVAGFTGAFTR